MRKNYNNYNDYNNFFLCNIDLPVTPGAWALNMCSSLSVRGASDACPTGIDAGHLE